MEENISSVSSLNQKEQSSKSTEQEDGTVCTDLTVDFFGEASGNPMNVSLNLPANWSSDSSGIFDGEGNWIASVELHKVTDAEQPFSDVDGIYNGVVFSKELMVSGYPAKYYVLEIGEDGNDAHTRTQYLYYIMVDDAYVLILFNPQGTTNRKGDEFDKIVSSFMVAES